MPLRKPLDAARTSDERHQQLQDNELIEVAIAVSGVLLLLVILLAIPFQDRSSDVTQFEKVTFIVALVSTSLSLVLLVATRLSHRRRSWLEDEESRIRRHQPAGEILAAGKEDSCSRFGCTPMV